MLHDNWTTRVTGYYRRYTIPTNQFESHDQTKHLMRLISHKSKTKDKEEIKIYNRMIKRAEFRVRFAQSGLQQKEWYRKIMTKRYLRQSEKKERQGIGQKDEKLP